MGNMETSATEFAKNFGFYRDMVQQEPVVVKSHNRIAGYFVSAAEYAEYTRLKSREAKAYAVEELSEKTIRLIALSKMDKRHNHLDALLDD